MKRSGILDGGESTNDVGESTLEVGKQTVGETTRRRNDRKPPKVPAHTGLTILDCLKRNKKTQFTCLLFVTKLISCMNFRMIQAVIKCFERSTVERIEENLNDRSRYLFIRLVVSMGK